MQNTRLDGMRVAILVSNDFEQIEMTEPRKALEQAGAITTLVSLKPGSVRGIHHDRLGDTFPVDIPFDQARPDQFDAVLLPGGALNADFLRANPQAQDFVRQMERRERPLAVICHAPWLLISAGLIKGRTITSWPTIQDDLRNAGARWIDQEVVRDRNWVSSRGPQDLPAFNPAMVALFAEYQARQPSA